MLKRINAVTVCMTIAGTAMIAAGGFLDGENYAASVVCLAVMAVFAYLAVRENGNCRKENRPH